MMALKDDWMRAAMADDGVAAELLIRLKQAHALAPVKSPMFPPSKWGVRQPRSRMAMRFDAATPRKEAADLRRHSPTTPLSWSAGAVSPSCTADGFEDSSFLCAATARSKGIGNSSTDFTNNSSIKRSRRKKTFAQLKEEESFLLKQKIYLNKEIENMQATYKEQRAKNQRLKKMKVDLYNNNHRDGTQEEKLCHFVSTFNKASSSSDSQTVSDPCQETHNELSASRKKDNVLFLLPDLNMEPCEEDSPGFEVF